MTERKQTRMSTNCPIFGCGEDMGHRELPTFHSVMKYYLLIRQSLKQKTNKDPSVSEIVKHVVEKLKIVWKMASIPIVSDQRIEAMLKTYHGKYRNILRPLKGRSNSNSYSEKVKAFKSEAQRKLFDIAACKCDLLLKCSCPKEKKIPKSEHAFIVDQRTERKMAIGNADWESSKKIAAKIARKGKKEAYLCKRDDQANNLHMEDSSSENDKNDDISDNQDEEEEYTATSKSKRQLKEEEDKSLPKKSKILHLPTLAAACDRVGVSDRGAALLASSLLQDIGVVCSNDTSDVIDRNKVRRARQRKRFSLQNVKETVKITGIYFDGRKDQTLTKKKMGNRWYSKKVQ